MTVLVAFASSEGQTRKIARHVADRIADSGTAVELVSFADAEDIDLGRFDRMILAASLHAGNYQRSASDFVAKHKDALNDTPSLFLSVSLAASGHDAEDWRGLDSILQDFKDATGWQIKHAEQVAGAYRPSKYDIFRRFIMRRIMAAKDPGADLDADKEFTDWPALDQRIDDWMGAIDLRHG